MAGRLLDEEELKILARLRAQIRGQKQRNTKRDQYDDGEHVLDKMPVSIPDSMKDLRIPIGWPDKACTARASRLRPAGYQNRIQTSLLDDVDEIFTANQWQQVERQAIRSAIRHGCSFVFTSRGNPALGEPEELMTVADAHNATALLDGRTRRTVAALELVNEPTPPGGFPLDRQILHLPGRSLVLENGIDGRLRVEDEVPTGTARVLCTPYVHDGSLQRPFGRSGITRQLMGLTDLGVRTLMRFESTSEFYSAPRVWMKSAVAELFEKTDDEGIRAGWEPIIGAILGLPEVFDEETGQVITPELQQLPQVTMQPLADGFRMIAAQVSGETSVPLSYLGVISDSNPTSADAIKASELDLVNLAIYLQDSFDIGRRSLALDVLTVRHDGLTAEMMRDLATLTPRWDDPRTRSITEQSQMVVQQVQAGNFQPGSVTTLRQLPISEEDVQTFGQEALSAQGRDRVLQILARAGAADDEQAGETALADGAHAARADGEVVA
jgi:hypothetical protein